MSGDVRIEAVITLRCPLRIVRVRRRTVTVELDGVTHVLREGTVFNIALTKGLDV